MSSWVEHEKSFMTSGPEYKFLVRLIGINPYPANIFHPEKTLSASPEIFTLDANSMDPDQTAPNGAFWSRSIVITI